MNLSQNKFPKLTNFVLAANTFYKVLKFYLQFKTGRFIYKKSNFPSTRNGLICIFEDKGQQFCTQIFNESIYSINTFHFLPKSLFGPIGTITRKIVYPLTVTRPVVEVPKSTQISLKNDSSYWLTILREKNVFRLNLVNQKAKLVFKKNGFREQSIEISDSNFTKVTHTENVTLINASKNFYLSQYTHRSKNRSHIHYIFIDTLYSFSKHNYLLRKCFKELHDLKLPFISFANHYSSSDWTMPSLATMLTGLEVHEHGVTNPGSNFSPKDLEDSIQPSHQTLFETTSDLGFFNTVISGNPRLNPMYGYSRGVNQFYYKPFLDQEQILSIWRNEISANVNNNSLFFLGLMDLHHPLHGENHEYNLLEYFKIIDKDKDFLFQLEGRDDSTQFFRNKYYLISRIIAKNLSNYIKSIIKTSEVNQNIFILTSDHSGVPSPKNQIRGHKSTERFHTPLMIFSDSCLKKSQELSEFISSKNFSTYFCNSFEKNNFNFAQFKSELFNHSSLSDYLLCEIIYPNQTYRAQLINKSRIIYIESKYIFKNRTIDLSEYVLETYDKVHHKFIENDSETIGAVNRFLSGLAVNSCYNVVHPIQDQVKF